MAQARTDSEREDIAGLFGLINKNFGHIKPDWKPDIAAGEVKQKAYALGSDASIGNFADNMERFKAKGFNYDNPAPLNPPRGPSASSGMNPDGTVRMGTFGEAIKEYDTGNYNQTAPKSTKPKSEILADSEKPKPKRRFKIED